MTHPTPKLRLSKADMYHGAHMIRYAVIALLIIAAGACLFLFGPVLKDCWISCPSIVMYGDLSVFERIYNGRSGAARGGVHVGLRDARSIRPLGWDGGTASWVFSAYDEGSPPSEHIVVYRGAKRVPVTLEHLPHFAQLKQSALLNGRVFVPNVEDGKMVVYCYALTGKLVQKRILCPPRVSIDELAGEDRLAIAQNGTVAAELNRKLYVFDSQGRVIRELYHASEPKLSPDGKMLAYQGEVAGNVVILDLRTGSRRVIKVWPQSSARIWEMLVTCSGFQVDWKHGWLLCAYEEGMSGPWDVYAADLNTPAPRWKRLFMLPDWWNWVMLDEAPKSLQR